jgi:hypothetical protein
LSLPEFPSCSADVVWASMDYPLRSAG